MRGKILLFASLALAIVALDLWSKHAVFDYLGYRGERPVIDGTFWLAHHHNTGGMWGIGQDLHPWVLRTVRLLAVSVIFVILAQTPRGDRWGTGALGLVLGGAAGNIYDSFAFGYVRDFLKFDLGFPPFHPFPTFNVADSAICVGVAMLALQMAFFPNPAPARNEAAKP